MPIQPIDMQTLFMRLNQVGKEQAVEREAAHLAQTWRPLIRYTMVTVLSHTWQMVITSPASWGPAST